MQGRAAGEDVAVAGLERRPVDSGHHAARFLDEHPLRWVGDFALRVSGRSRSPFYGGLVLVIAAYLDELRDYLAEALDLPRPEPVVEEAQEETETDEPATYFPGAGPSW